VRAGGLPLRGLYSMLSVGWTERPCPDDLVPVRWNGVTLHADDRIARYTTWHPITITARRWGPFVQLQILDEPLVEQRLVNWEHSHPDLGYSRDEAGSSSAA
jgi:hypothetical protein